MNKIKLRCMRGFGIVGNHYNVEVTIPLSGFGYSKKLYCCDTCGELFAVDLDNPNLKCMKELSECLSVMCPNCHIQLKDHLFPYPENVFVSGRLQKMNMASISCDRDHSSVSEFWEICPQPGGDAFGADGRAF